MAKTFGWYQGIAVEYMKAQRVEGRKVSSLTALIENMRGNIMQAFLPDRNQAWGKALLILSGIEMAHYGLGHKVICIDSDSAIPLAEQKNIVRLYDLQFPAPIFEICFENDALLPDGTPLPSLLISLPSEARSREFARLLGRSFLQNAPLYAGDFGVAIGRILEQQANILLDIADGKRPITDSWYTDELSTSVFVVYSHNGLLGFIQLPARVDADIEDIIKGLVSVSSADGRPFDDAQENLRVSLARIALNFLIYLNAGGSLNMIKLYNRPKFGNVPPEAGMIPTEMGWHFRRAHYRTLRDKRYYRSQQFPPERFRIIRVKNSVVRRDQIPAEPKRNVIWPV